MEMFLIIKCHKYGKDARKTIASTYANTSYHRTANQLRIDFDSLEYEMTQNILSPLHFTLVFTKSVDSNFRAF